MGEVLLHDGKVPPDLKRYRTLRGTAMFGICVIMIFFGGFGFWAASAPMNSAIVGSGVFVVTSNRQKVQHREGGIVSEILARDGDHVLEGQTLVRLSPNLPLAEYNAARLQVADLEIRRARLEAQRNLKSTINLSRVDLGSIDQKEVESIILAQTQAFETRFMSYTGQVDILQNRAEQLEKAIDGQSLQIQSIATQHGLIMEELKNVQDLFEKGLERRGRMLALEREAAALDGQKGRLIAERARNRLAEGEAQLQIINLRNSYVSEAAEQLKDVQAQLDSARQRLYAAQDILGRLDVVAPMSGVVVNSNVSTVGGVVAPGDTLMEVVPLQDELLVKAKIRPQDVESLSSGMAVNLNLVSFSQRNIPVVQGKLDNISADVLIDQNSGMSYYEAKILIEGDIDGVTLDEIVPGMPVDVMIPINARTALDYAIEPLARSFNRALKEQ